MNNQFVEQNWKVRVEDALSALKAGRGVLVTDDAERENEGDLIFAAEKLGVKEMALLIRECSGIVCLCLPQERVQSLGLRPMVEENQSRYQTAFTVSIEAAQNVTTGVSAVDRVATIKAAIAENANSDSLCSPGHVFPLQAKAGGVLERGGHTEATVDLMRLAGLQPFGVLCELMNEDGSMAKGHEIDHFAEKHGYPVLSVSDIVLYRQAFKL